MPHEGVSVVKALLYASAVLALLLHVTAKPRSPLAPRDSPGLAELAARQGSPSRDREG